MNKKFNFKEKTIGILAGGFSNEREVSLRSGNNVHRILSEHGYRAIFIDLLSRDRLALELANHKIDIVFNTLHGFYGEDGQLQGDLNFLGVPYTGSGVGASTVGMNKYWTKMIAQSLGFHTAQYIALQRGDLLADTVISFPFPWFIKPMYEGSSRDTHIVKSQKDKEELTLITDKAYLIEEMILGDEVTSGILTATEQEVVLPILKLVAHNEFYDYEAKYTAGKTEFFCPAPLNLELTEKIQKSSLKMHQVLGCCGASRCDYIIQNGSQKPYFLEINTSPGMTELSDIPIEARSFGWSEIELCEFILQSSL